jgi:hypothetical protein
MIRRYICSAFILIALVAQSFAQPLQERTRCKNSASLVFSASYALCLPLSFYRDAAIVAIDGLTVKYADGPFFFGQILLPATVDLPGEFDMRLFPRYLYGLAAAENLPHAQREKMEQYRDAQPQQMNRAQLRQINTAGKTIYLVSDGQQAEAYISSDDLPDQVLLMGFEGISAAKVSEILKGVK